MSLPLRRFGDGSPMVSALTLGTAAFTYRYAGQPPPEPWLARRLLHEAFAAGVNLVDTAPGYGSQPLVGEVLKRHPDVMVATKLPGDVTHADGTWQVDRSRQALGRERLDLLLLHSPTALQMWAGHAVDVLWQAKASGATRLIGASVYTFGEARAALDVGLDVVQVPYSLLDQRLASFLETARQQGVTVLARSVWLQGALASQPHVPDTVRKAALRAQALLLASRTALPSLAVRFALQAPVASLVIGPRTSAELRQAVAAAQAGPLPWWRTQMAARCALGTTDVDPRSWPEEADRT